MTQATALVKEKAINTPQYEFETYYEPDETALVVFMAASKQYYADYIEEKFSDQTRNASSCWPKP